MSTDILGRIASGDRGGITIYHVPDAVEGSPYSLVVDGAAVPIEKAGEYNGAYYARFEFRDTVKAEVQVKATAATTLTLKPERFRTGLERSGGSGIRFDIDKPGPRVITVVCGSRELWPLIVFAEEPTVPWQNMGKAVYKVEPDAREVRTAQIQEALDRCGESGGGVVEFGPGVYRTGPLFVRSNTTLVTAPGCLIEASTEPADYRVDGEWNEHHSHGPTAACRALINFRGCRNSKLVGQGVIEARGHILRNEHGINMSTLTISDSEDIEVSGVVLRNSPSWTVHVLGSQNVSIDGVKVVADWAVGNTDGINPDCSQNVSISNYFGYCGDDAVAIKTTSASDQLQGSSNVRVRDCIVMTRKTSFKIGTETHKDVRDVVFERCEAVNSSRGIGLYMRDGGTISNITYRDLKLDLMEYPGESASGAPYTAVIEKRFGVGKIRDIKFERVAASAPYNSGLFGMPESSIDDVTFKDCTLEVRDRTIKMRRAPVFDLRHCRDVRFANFKVRWDTALENLWEGFLREEDCEGIAVEGLREER